MLMIHDMLRRSSVDHPHKEAVVCGEKRLSYLDLEESSTKLAAFLLRHGLDTGDRIGILANKDVEESIAIFAALRSGGVMVHINPQYKAGQLYHVISDCNIKVLFVSDSKSVVLDKACPGDGPLDMIISLTPQIAPSIARRDNVFYLADILNESARYEMPDARLTEDSIASIIYTSGSTGLPKGVIVTHKILYDSTVVSASVLENNAADRLISVTPFSFDGALSQLFTACFVNGTLVLQPSTFPKDIVQTLLGERITGFHAVPSLWGILLQELSPFSKHEYPDLRYISIIGEVFPEQYLDNLKQVLRTTQIYMMYGTTEAFRSTYLPPEDLQRKQSCVGIPFPGVEISVVDKQNRTCRPGEVGEIVHKGLFISPGYWNDSGVNGDIFRGDVLYTGDLGQLDDEGYLYFVGRKDSMIKVQGQRVSPEEIEQCLHQIDGVREAAAIGIPGDGIGTRIKVIIAPKDGACLSEKDIIRHCRNHFASYMVPSIVEFRKDLPRTSSNKINRSELC